MITLQCAPEDYDQVTHTCSDPFYSESESAFSGLTLEQANDLALAIASLWALAWVFRRIIRFLNQS